MYGENLKAVYQNTRRQGQRGRFWSALSGHSRRLIPLSEIETQCTVRGRHDAGLRTVRVDQIRGSSGRYNDFDHDFCPLQDHTERRWLSVARAREEGKSLPPVDLVQVGETYYCLDGHHRISVAHAFQQSDIEANVTVWQVEGPLPGAASEGSTQHQPDSAETSRGDDRRGWLNLRGLLPAGLRAGRAAAH